MAGWMKSQRDEWGYVKGKTNPDRWANSMATYKQVQSWIKDEYGYC
jgi:hypothetical protein